MGPWSTEKAGFVCCERGHTAGKPVGVVGGMVMECFLHDGSCFLHEACGEGKLGGLSRERGWEINVLECGKKTHWGKLLHSVECPFQIHGENFKGGH